MWEPLSSAANGRVSPLRTAAPTLLIDLGCWLAGDFDGALGARRTAARSRDSNQAGVGVLLLDYAGCWEGSAPSRSRVFRPQADGDKNLLPESGFGNALSSEPGRVGRSRRQSAQYARFRGNDTCRGMPSFPRKRESRLWLRETAGFRLALCLAGMTNAGARLIPHSPRSGEPRSRKRSSRRLGGSPALPRQRTAQFLHSQSQFT